MLDESTQFDRSIDRIADQAVSDQPFPHFYVEDVFSADVFAKIHEVSAKMAQSGIGSISPWAAISAMVVDWTPAPSEIT